MKKMSLLIATLLVLVSGIVFCGCGNKYKKLNISLGNIVYGSEDYYVENGEISLVLDDSVLSKCGVTFNISGVKEWGSVSVASSPTEVIKVESCSASGTTCNVVISALQPVEGGELIITHLGSGKNCKVPLNIGKKLQDVKVNNQSYVLQRPTFEEDESERVYEIPTNDLLDCKPLNYTDLIVWKQQKPVTGVEVVTYDRDGNVVDGDNLAKAVRSEIIVSKSLAKDVEIDITPLSILDGEVTDYSPQTVTVYITDLLDSGDIAVTSKTHGDIKGKLHELALISNPAEDAGREDDSYAEYDLYSTAVIELKLNNPDEKTAEENPYIGLNSYELLDDLYDITAYSNIQGLTLEYVEFGKIRAIATSTCYGEGDICVNFTPKNSIGDINSFELKIPCTVGERATSFSVVNNGERVVIENSDINNYDFKAITPLNDSNSVGQAFRFQMLSTNTLSALKQYRITIHKDLLYINPEFIKDGKSPYIYNSEEMVGDKLYDLNGVTGNLYQISILKDGNQIKFYHESESDYFVSEPLSSRNMIYIKWNLNKGKDLDSQIGFGISVSNWYNGDYDTAINENKFKETQIKLKLDFNRQRTVGSIDYQPTYVTPGGTGGKLWDADGADPTGPNWQFYLSNDMLVSNDELGEVKSLYGFYITDVFGLNNETLNDDEKQNVNINITIRRKDCDKCIGKSQCECDTNLGVAVLDIWKDATNIEFKKELTYNYQKVYSDIILIGKIDSNDVVCDDYIIEFRQDGGDIKAEPLIKRNITIYKPLTEDDINVDIPLANFKGNVLQSEYVKIELNDRPNSLDGYYILENYEYKPADKWDSTKTYYVKKDNVYVLATSSQYLAKFDYKNRDFIGDAGVTVERFVIGDLTYDTTNMCGIDQYGNQIIKTGLNGTFNEGKENFIQLRYTISVNKYDYYQRSDESDEIQKNLLIYIYKPVTKAVLNKTNIEKYSYTIEDGTYNNDLMELYGKETLTLSLNNGDDDVFNYVDVGWSSVGGRVDFDTTAENSCTYIFYNTTDTKKTGRLIATIKQFGIEIPVYCSYSIQKPVLSKRVELDTTVNVFKSGNPYINLKVGESKQFSATVKGEDDKPASFNIVEYLICSPMGTQSNGVATVSSNGLVTATNPGKAKLIIVAKDCLDSNWRTTQSSNYLKYVNGKPCVIIDIIVSDGSVGNPYLIANSNDFKNIQNDFVEGVNKNHYALISNINLNGQGVTFNGEFRGSISSFKQYENDDTRFRIAGIMLTYDNPVVFTNLKGTIENVSFNLDINYIENVEQNKNGESVSIALIGENNGTIKDVTVIADGQVIVGESKNSYTIASLVAINNGEINLTDTDVVAVEANIKVEGNSISTITLGGIIGQNIGSDQNSGSLKGAQSSYNDDSNDDSNDELYSNIYYGKQGITAYVNLQVTNSSDAGALGGAIGFNNGGNVTNVLTDGTVYGIDDAKALSVNNVGGIIGKNAAKVDMPAEIIIAIIAGTNDLHVSDAEFTGSEFQITESYSTAKVKGKENVGGAVGHDTHGSYQHVYYEMYTSGEGVQGQENVGGLIGNANNSDLLYCYANNFGWGYKSKEYVTTYDIIGETNVGGLIGLANSKNVAPANGTHTSLEITTVISSAASVTIKGSSKVAGLIGLIEQYKFAAIYTAYYYGVIDASQYEGIANHNTMLPYYNVYWIVNGVDSKEHTTYKGYYQGPDESETSDDGFMLYGGQNNNEPYIVDEEDENIINPIPTLITIADSDSDSLLNWYKQDDNGEYYKDNNKYLLYTKDVVGNPTRFTLRGSVIDAEDTNSNPSDYRAKALILYYYGLTDIADEDVLEAAYEFNKVNMDSIIDENKILIVPESLKRVTLKSSDSSIVRVLDDGYLLLLNEGQVTITMTSIINPSVSASFVVIVRSKVKAFSLHTSASLHNDFVINNDTTLSIVKGSSKIIYPNVKSTVNYFDKEFNYKPATRVGTQLTITCSDETVNIKDYIELNGTLDKCVSVWYGTDGNPIDTTNTKPNPETDKQVFTQLVYRIPFGTPITISVKDYCENTFNVEAVPYVISDYKADNGTSITADSPILDGYSSTFNISTKRGASAINANKNHIVMMPADSETNLNVKIATDTVQEYIYIDVEAIGDWQVDDPLGGASGINVVEMLDITGLDLVDLNGDIEGLDNPYRNQDNSIKTYCLEIGTINLTNNLQEFELKLKLNEKSHYINKSLKLQITIYLKDENGYKVKLDGQNVQAVTFIDIEPQTMSSMIARNYRKNGVKLESDGKIRDKNLNQSTLIRPGSINIIGIDIAPNIAVFDYVEIVDSLTTERILLRQVYKDSSGAYKTPANMDKWVDNGIKLRKLGSDGNDSVQASQLFVEARLPSKAITNITHTLSMIAYRDGQAVYTTHLNVEAIAYPTVIMTYTPPKGQSLEVDTSAATETSTDEETGRIVVSAEGETNLAVGVEAGVTVQTHNIDEGSLTPEVKIYKADGSEVTTPNDILKLEYRYGKYILLFNKEHEALWSSLLGNTIHLTFKASKSLNGSTEYCEATIKFKVQKFVIHAISMTHTSSQGDLYGDWDDEFVTQFYFDKTDISYYNNISNTYWNTKYELQADNAFEGINEPLKTDLEKINEILKEFNEGFGGTNGTKKIKLIDLNNNSFDLIINNSSQTFDRQVINGEVVETGFSIKHEDNHFKIHAKDPSIAGGKDINDYRLNVEFPVKYVAGYPSIDSSIDSGTDISNSFGFNVSKKTTPFDEYITIYTQAELEDMLEGKYYQLGDNITLNNYTPSNVAIGGFNGGKYSITIASFNEDQLHNDYLTGDINIGLFGTLAENSIIQNLRVVYRNDNNMDLWAEIDLNQQFEEHPGNNVHFGGIAGINLGVITNVEVSGQVEIRANNIAAQLIDCGGITALNGDTSVETQKDAAITNSTVTLHINAIALVGGIAGTNNGKIATTNFDGRISSYMATTSYVSDVLTAGFVVNNSSGATISLSYVEFTRDEDNIRSVGDTAGFVLDNSGTITNCYINGAKIHTQGSIGGFVYKSSGDIINSYSKVETKNSLFYSKFIYDTSTVGTITNSYCITDGNNNPKLPGLEIVRLINIENTIWNGFIFAEITSEGIWTKTVKGPKLVNAGFNSNYDEYDDIYNIYDVETYEGWLKQFDENKNYTIEGITIQIVRDIDFEAEGFVGNPTTVNKTLMSNIEGNNMEISNFTIYKLEQGQDDLIDDSQHYVGLFKEVKYANIRNLNLIPAEVKASSAYAVGVLAGAMDSAKLYNINIDNDNLLVLGRNAVGGLAGIIVGDLEIVGVTSNVSVLSSYKHGTGKQYNMYLGKNVTGVAGFGNVNEVSYAGSIAGIVDGYSAQTPQGDIDFYQRIRDVNAGGTLVLAGENVGALFGLVGETTLIKNSHYTVPAKAKYQGAYVSGGLVGENRGIIQDCSVIAEVVESERVSTEDCFNNFAKINGGLVGTNVGGLIDNCTVYVDVCTKVNFATVGGVVGRNVEGSVYNTTLVGGKLKGYFVGGIVGADYGYSTMSKALTGEATITKPTLEVFNNLYKDGFNAYQSNSVTTSDFDVTKPFTNNVFGRVFIETFIANKVYTYNVNHGGQQNKLVNVTSIYGLVVGYSEHRYGVAKNDESDTEADYNYEKYQLTVTLTLVNTDNEAHMLSERYEVDTDKGINITCITQINDKTFIDMFTKANGKINESVMMLYLVAYVGAAGYESWSSASGYSNKFIIVGDF